jgi:uncharacterized protein (TIGR00251 family)
MTQTVNRAMNFEAALSNGKPGTVLRIHVVPHSKKYTIEYDEWRKELKIRVRAQPKEGKANQDLIRFLSQYFRKPVLLSGATSRSKQVQIENTFEEAVKILEEIL